jgi:hypothetical protein
MGPDLPALKRLEAERDRLLAEGAPIEYAKGVIAKANNGPIDPTKSGGV